MSKIYKYSINTDEPIIGNFAKILKVDWQDGELFLWALIDDLWPEKELIIKVIPTGVDFTVGTYDQYLDTVQDGFYVWHIFYFLRTVKKDVSKDVINN